MKKFILLFPLFISGCYLANGSPPAHRFWMKNDGTYEGKEWEYCSKKSYESLNEYQLRLINKAEDNWKELYQNKEEYKKYREALKIESKVFSQCLYDSGYRFRPPLYWCLAQDGDNTNICSENMKYRN
ncbi:hypothetical protein GVX86_09720 [[Haemophilus] felis]|nr:hypothetical protein [[Haemophilus] felis]